MLLPKPFSICNWQIMVFKYKKNRADISGGRDVGSYLYSGKWMLNLFWIIWLDVYVEAHKIKNEITETRKSVGAVDFLFIVKFWLCTFPTICFSPYLLKWWSFRQVTWWHQPASWCSSNLVSNSANWNWFNHHFPQLNSSQRAVP